MLPARTDAVHATSATPTPASGDSAPRRRRRRRWSAAPCSPLLSRSHSFLAQVKDGKLDKHGRTNEATPSGWKAEYVDYTVQGEGLPDSTIPTQPTATISEVVEPVASTSAVEVKAEDVVMAEDGAEKKKKKKRKTMEEDEVVEEVAAGAEVDEAERKRLKKEKKARRASEAAAAPASEEVAEGEVSLAYVCAGDAVADSSSVQPQKKKKKAKKDVEEA